MKVIILGGCGGMGRYASKAISSFDQVQSLTIADLNNEDAEEFANQLGSQVKGIDLNIFLQKKIEMRHWQFSIFKFFLKYISAGSIVLIFFYSVL